MPLVGGSSGVPKPLAWALLGAILALPVLVIGVGSLRGGESPIGDPGALTETRRMWRPEDGRLPTLVDMTDSGGFSVWRHTEDLQLSGGAAIADVDADGTADIVVGGGSAGVFFGTADALRWQFVELVGPDQGVTSVSVDDIDADGRQDVLLGTALDEDIIVWGGPWAESRTPALADRTELESGRPTTGLLAADLDADGLTDVVRLGYGPEAGATPDVVWSQTQARTFEPHSLPNSARRSLSAELVDVDEDGDAEIWVTRDVGWASGADSLYSREPTTGEWTDIAEQLGTDLAVDGMGVTVADLNGDSRLDAYVSDLGDNELLVRQPDGSFLPVADVGVARIRPPGAPASEISSSWASAAVDLNLDGRLDVVVANGGFGQEADIPNKIEGTSVVDDDPPALLLARSDGVYADVWPELDARWEGRARGLSAGDLDGDGDIDLVFVVHGEGLRVLRNDTPGPTIQVELARGCSTAAMEVHVSSDLGTFTSLLRGHTFLGAHEAGAIVAASGSTRIEVSVGETTVTRTLDPGAGRSTIVLACPR